MLSIVLGGPGMPGEKRFRTSLFGFKKADVNYYIEKMLREFDEQLKSKSSEIDALRQQNRDLKELYDEVSRRIENIEEDRAKIAEVMIKASDKADMIINEARTQAIQEKKEIEDKIKAEEEKLEALRWQLKNLRSEVISTLKKIENELGRLSESGNDEFSAEGEADAEAEVAAGYEDGM